MSNLIKPPNDGGPAFPLNNFTYPNGETEIGFNGMTLRDYFAAKALAGLSALDWVSMYKQAPPSAKEYAENAYCIADAMVKAREERR